MNRTRFEVLKKDWFKELSKIAAAHPQLFPRGVVNGVVLNIVTVATEQSGSELLRITPAISPALPPTIALVIKELFERIFES